MDELMKKVDDMSIKAWTEHTSDCGHDFYYNEETGESSWVHPLDEYHTVQVRTAASLRFGQRWLSLRCPTPLHAVHLTAGLGCVQSALR